MSNIKGAKNSKRKKILFISEPGEGGAVISLYCTLCGLDKNRFEPIVLFYKNNIYIDLFAEQSEKVFILENIAPNLVDRGTKARKLNRTKNANIFKRTFFLLSSLWFDIRLSVQGIKLIKNERIDLIHHNMAFVREMVLSAIVTNTPQISHCRHFYKFTSSAKKLSRFINHYFYVSGAIEKLFIKQGIEESRGDILYEPIDTSIYYPINDTSFLREEFNLSKHTKIITNIGRITHWKGQDWFLEAMKSVIEEYPDVSIWIVGEPGTSEADQQFHKKLQEIAKTGGLKDKVVFTGLRNDMAQIMSASDVVVHSSVKPEPFGRVIAEAMATHTPVIATAAGGALEIIADQETGLLVPAGDSKTMAKSVLQLITDIPFSEKLSENGYQSVTKKFTLSNHIEIVHRVYDTILNT